VSRSATPVRQKEAICDQRPLFKFLPSRLQSYSAFDLILGVPVRSARSFITAKKTWRQETGMAHLEAKRPSMFVRGAGPCEKPSHGLKVRHVTSLSDVGH